ncbi:Photosystem I reaction center subunit N, chloroplastic [Triticum urartu]|uniref:Photosystem I reaction center subunit N, chloroplastic n=1 Tax=Triticum urartu TaxID=4572 RepID=M7ZE25_TRIUA|nr:Photosystem I reaction center subunit N, chloroplastic [Triticum urartu]
MAYHEKKMPDTERSFLFGNSVPKSALARITENTKSGDGVVVMSMADVPLGFGVAARGAQDCRKADTNAVVVLHQSDAGEYLRKEEELIKPASPAAAKRVQVAPAKDRRSALLGLAAVFAVTAASAGSARASVFDEYLEKSKLNKELNDKKRAATSGANFARAYTVQFGSCKFPYNFTGCQDLAKQKKVPFITDDLEIECEGKEKFKCGSNVFWKW